MLLFSLYNITHCVYNCHATHSDTLYVNAILNTVTHCQHYPTTTNSEDISIGNATIIIDQQELKHSSLTVTQAIGLLQSIIITLLVSQGYSST